MRLLLLIGLLVPASACLAAATDAFESEPVLKAAALVRPELLNGPGYRVVPEVPVRGYMANFLIDTQFGPLRADSVQMLGVRVAELPAVIALEHASRSAAFARALAARGRKTGAAILNVVTHPVDTVTGLPQGVARFFSGLWDTWSGRAQSLADRSTRQFENNGDPFRAPHGPMTAARDAPAVDPAEHADNHAWYARIGNETARESRRYLKFGQQRRAMAKVLNVDPESTNPLLAERLDALAWAAVWGNFSAGAALGQVAGSAAEVVSWSGKLDQYVLSRTPEQLREINREALSHWCSDDYAVRQFLRRGGFSDTLRTAMVQSLQRLEPRTGCDGLLELAAKTHGEVEARYLVDALKMVERQEDSIGGTLLVAGAALAWRTPSGRLLLPLPVDYLTWNAHFEAFLRQPRFATAGKLALVGGEASLAAQRALTERGWGMVLRAQYDGAPAYATHGEFAPR